jgi:hypothetical protein
LAVICVRSIAKGPKISATKTQKGPKKNSVGKRKSGAEFLPDLSKKVRKEMEVFKVYFFIQSSIDFLPKTMPINWFI